MTVHKSQSSSYYNVFVDTDDILNNNNINDCKRCIYTAYTRAINELHINL
jgi:ATP-dependent exoDNAse (exonuclease V) alpha subunit